MKTGARGMPGIQFECNAVDTRLSSSPTHLISQEPGYEASSRGVAYCSNHFKE